MYNKNKEEMFLNLINEKCPITFVKIKLSLEKLKKGKCLNIRLKDKEAIDGLSSSLNELGFRILSRLKTNEEVFEFKVTHKN